MPQDTIDPQRAAQLRKEAEDFCKEFLPDPTTPCNMDHINDALNYKCPELPAATRMAACNEAHVNEVKTLELEPRLIGMDLAKDPAQTKLIERRPDGKLIVHDLSSLSEQDLKQMISDRAQAQFDKIAMAVQEVGEAFEVAGKAAQVFQTELKAIETVQLSADMPTVSKYRHGKQIPARQYEKAKKRRAMQAQSRKRNRR
jgi:hypothetical protein